jgi:DUF4097 and DUF4098 domain-containing protein YvlB
VRVHGISGPLDVRTTLKDVVINDYDDTCSVTSEYADISVSSRNLGKGDLKLKNQNGNVTLYLPEKASFIIDAAARNGRVESNYSALGLGKERDVRELKTKVNNGGPKLQLETSNGNIRIHPTQDLEADQDEKDSNSDEN